jgi:hypothetical protein
MKLEITPTSVDAPAMIATGTFKEMKFMLVRRSLNTRHQTLIGECLGRTLAKKSLGFDSLWISSLVLDSLDKNNLLAIGAIVVLTAIAGV